MIVETKDRYQLRLHSLSRSLYLMNKDLLQLPTLITFPARQYLS